MAQSFSTVAIGGGGYVDGIVACPTQPNLFYARTDVGGAYRWDEPSKSWIALLDWNSPNQTSYQGVEAIAVDPQSPNRVYIVAGTSYLNNDLTAVLCSSDYGSNFTITDVTSKFKANGNGGDRNKGEELAVDPNLGSILFCGSRANGLFKSTDYGATWNAVSSFNTNITISTDSISFVMFDNASGSSGTATPQIFVGVFRTGNNLFVSNDGGATWTALTGSPSASVPERCALANNNTLYIAYGTGNNGCIMKYTVTNGFWASCTPGGIAQTYGAISVCPTNANKLIASTYSVWDYQPGWGGYGDKIYVSTNAGASWVDLFGSGKITLDANGFTWITGAELHWAGTIVMDPFNSDRVFVGSGNGIFSTSNLNSGLTTSTWKFMVKGLEETVAITFSSVPGGPFITSVGDVNGFVHTDITVPPSSAISQSSSIAYATKLTNFIVRAIKNGGVYYTTGSPYNWTQFATTPSGMAAGTVAVAADGTAVLWNSTVSNANTCYVTTNRGATWTASTGLTFSCNPEADWQNPSKFYAYNSGDGYLYASTDGGLTFSRSGSAGTGGSKAFCVAPGLEGHIWISRGGLQYSTNSGASFKSANVTEADSFAFGKIAPGATYPTLFIWGKPTSSSTIGMYRSTDMAATWVRVNDNAHQYGGLGNAGMIEGDKNVYGRVYMSTVGRGVPYMDSAPQTNYYNQAVLAYHPVAFYELNEMSDPSTGSLAANDSVGGFNGTYGNNAKNGFNGISGPAPAAYPGFLANNTALKTTPTLANAFVTVPAWNLNTNTVTLMAWIYPTNSINTGNPALVFCRAGSTVAGFRYSAGVDAQGRATLGYNWNNDTGTTGWSSGLVPPTNQWSMVALVVSPTNASVYLINTNGTQTANFVHSHTNAAFDGSTEIGSDSNTQSRTFGGSIDEVAVFNTCLSAAQLQNLFGAGMGVFTNPPSFLQPPVSLGVYSGTTARLSFTVNGDLPLQYQWLSGAVGSGVYTNVPVGGRISVGTNGTLVISNFAAGDQMDYVVRVSNSAGVITSGPATLTVRQADLAASAVLANSPVAFYELNELGNPATGGVIAQDDMGGFNGAYGTTSQNGYNNYYGPQPAAYPGFSSANTALKTTNGDTNSIVTLPNLNLNTNTVTIVAWIKPNTLANDRGIVYCRGNGTTAGLSMGNHGDNALGYNWNDNANAYNWDSTLVPNVNEWAMVALVISPNNAVMYLMSPTKGILAATNAVANVNQSFANPTTIGTDVFGAAGRAWDGGIDDVAIYNYCLSRSQLTSLFTAGSGVGAPTASFALGPASGVGSVTVNFTNTTTGTVVSGLWSFGDGATSNNMTSGRVQHAYTQAGCVAATYYPVLSVTNSGWVSTFTNPTPVIVYPPAPTPSFALSKANVTTNEAVSFTDTSSGCVSNRLWRFGDGAISSVANPTHAYAVAGSYNVTLAATNAYGGGTVSLARTVTVTNMPSLVIRPASVVITAVSLYQGTNIQLLGSNLPIEANTPFNVLWTDDPAAARSGWLTNVNVTGDGAFNGRDGSFTNVIINGASESKAFFLIEVP